MRRRCAPRDEARLRRGGMRLRTEVGGWGWGEVIQKLSVEFYLFQGGEAATSSGEAATPHPCYSREAARPCFRAAKQLRVRRAGVRCPWQPRGPLGLR